MPRAFQFFVVAATLIGFPAATLGQSASGVAFIPSIVFVYQAPDKTYSSPYLDRSIGPFAWGASLTVLGQQNGFTFGGEINSARYSKKLTGRVVSTRYNEFHSPLPTQVTFQETFASALFGYSDDQRTVRVVGGPAVSLGAPKYEGTRRAEEATDHWYALTGGINFLFPKSRQIQVAIGGRYFYVFSSDNDEWSRIGLGRNIFQATVGVSFGSSD